MPSPDAASPEAFSLAELREVVGRLVGEARRLHSDNVALTAWLAHPQSGQRPPGLVPCAATLRRSEASGVICSTRQPGMRKKSDMPHAMGSHADLTNYQSTSVTIHAERGRTEIRRPPQAAATRSRAWHFQRLSPTAQGGMIRHSQGKPEQADGGADQALGLAPREAEYRPERWRCQECRKGMPGLSAPRRARLRSPGRGGLVGEPHRQAAAPAQGSIIRSRVRDLALLLGNAVTAVLVQLGTARRASGTRGEQISCVGPTGSVPNPIRATALGGPAVRAARPAAAGMA